MKEIADILKAYGSAGHHPSAAALATVVRVQGSAYRKPGARMLILGDGVTVGGVSGGCIERDVVYRAGAVAAGGNPVVVRYDTTPDEDGRPTYSLGCGGAVDVLIESLAAPDGAQAMRMLKSLSSARRRGAIAVVIAISPSNLASVRIGQRMALDETGAVGGDMGSAELTEAVLPDARAALDAEQSQVNRYPQGQGWAEVLIEFVEPPLELVMIGAGADATPLIALARVLGWHVTVIDLRSGPAGTRRLDADTLVRCGVEAMAQKIVIGSRAAVVIMTHNYAHDLAALRWLAHESLLYLGVLGPRHRLHRLLGELPADDAARLREFYAPIGLDIGARTPEEIALAIAGEITAVLRGRPGGMLRDRPGPIHERHGVEAAAFTSEVNPCPAAAS